MRATMKFTLRGDEQAARKLLADVKRWTAYSRADTLTGDGARHLARAVGNLHNQLEFICKVRVTQTTNKAVKDNDRKERRMNREAVEHNGAQL